MKKPASLFAFLLLTAGAALAEDAAKTPTKMLCTLAQVQICSAEQGCKTKTADEVGAPRFIAVDPVAKEFVAIEENRRSAIGRVEVFESSTFLQGIENRRAWSAVIADDGFLTLAAADDGVAFVVFGSCVDVKKIKQ
jgi:hypothetical protein